MLQQRDEERSADKWREWLQSLGLCQLGEAELLAWERHLQLEQELAGDQVEHEQASELDEAILEWTDEEVDGVA